MQAAPRSATTSADAYYSGGTTCSVTRTDRHRRLASPAPQQVYQTERSGNFTYTIPHLVPGIPTRPAGLRRDLVECTRISGSSTS